MKNYKPDMKFEEVTITEEKRVRRPAGPPKGPRPIPYDEQAFNRTEIGQRRLERTALYESYRHNPMHPDVIKYWAQMGLKKELFDSDGVFGFDAKHAYSVFTPMDMDWSKKYALIYFCHGGGQPIEWAETYGFNTLAALEKYIVVYAQNGGRSNEEVDAEFPRIMEQIRQKGYPVDWERVYAVGFSSGSSACVCAACTYPRMVAAVASLPGGIPFNSLDFYSGAGYYASTEGCRIPAIFIGGMVDRDNFPAPWMKDYRDDNLVVGTLDNAVENLNVWLRDIAQTKNYAPLTKEGICDILTAINSPVEAEFGLRFDKTYSFRAEGTDWLGGDFYGEDGAPVVRCIRAAGVPHVVWESQANIVWDYLKHFRRNPVTGESLYDPVACWGER